jgi:hypothetical protein
VSLSAGKNPFSPGKRAFTTEKGPFPGVQERFPVDNQDFTEDSTPCFAVRTPRSTENKKEFIEIMPPDKANTLL